MTPHLPAPTSPHMTQAYAKSRDDKSVHQHSLTRSVLRGFVVARVVRLFFPFFQGVNRFPFFSLVSYKFIPPRLLSNDNSRSLRDNSTLHMLSHMTRNGSEVVNLLNLDFGTSPFYIILALPSLPVLETIIALSQTAHTFND